MKLRYLLIMTFCVFGLVWTSADAELQNVQIGGEIHVFGSYNSRAWVDEPTPRLTPGLLLRRVTGNRRDNDPLVPPFTESFNLFDRRQGHNEKFLSQITKLNVSADFTDGVSAFIELMETSVWGDNFRADWITGAKNRGGDDKVNLFQAYIEADDMFGFPLRARIGRQVLEFGSGWLVSAGPQDETLEAISFDAIRLTWSPIDLLTLDLFASKLNEVGSAEEDGDTDFYGAYLSYGIDLHDAEFVFDLYYYLLRDAQGLRDTDNGWKFHPRRIIESWFGINDYDPVYMHTFGARTAGYWGGFDWELEGAYQLGNADAVGFQFTRSFFGTQYGDNRAKFKNWAAHGELGYTFDVHMSPRVYAGFQYYGGEDNRDVTFFDWLNPFARPVASVSFNRLFSNHYLEDIMDDNTMSNAWSANLGLQLELTESLSLDIYGTYSRLVEPFSNPWNFNFFNRYYSLVGPFTFLTSQNSRDLGYQISTELEYQYSDDLTFALFYCHMITGDAYKEFVNYSLGNGLFNIGGRDNDSVNLVVVSASLKF